MTGCPCPPHTDQHTAETGAGLTAYEAWRATAPPETFDDGPRRATGLRELPPLEAALLLAARPLAPVVGDVARALAYWHGDAAVLHLYAPPLLAPRLLEALEVLPGARGWISTRVPPGSLHVALEQLDDPTAREVRP